jgi:DNA-binding NarL/FixJ family response regulator
MTRRVDRSSVRLKLTAHQQDCLLLVARGNTDRQIAEDLGLSQQTVRKHIQAAKRHYSARTRLHLVIRALTEKDLELTQIVT